MLTHHLKGAIQDLQDLIKIIQDDIADIKEAKHNPQFERLSIKDEKLHAFESKKAMIDHEIATLMADNQDTELPQLLNEEQHKLLEQLKENLNKLHTVNQEYARFVVIVSNLYNEFLERIVPTEMQGYNKVASKEAAIMEVRV